MLIDLHMHSSEGSSDSHISIPQIVSRAKELGLDAVCITDHDNMDVYDYAKELEQTLQFKILVGVEILTFEGDILVYGIRDLPTEKIHSWELTKYVHQRGGATIAAHPFRQNNRGLGHLIATTPYLDGVEVFNGSTLAHQNLQAYSIALEKNLALSGASDCHLLNRIGTFCTQVDGNINTEQDLVHAIKERRLRPFVYEDGIYQPIKAYGQHGIAV